MDRFYGSQNSGSRTSLDSFEDLSYLSLSSSPSSSFPPALNGDTVQGAAPATSSDITSTEPTLFNIERDGDSRIEWFMYYDFTVTKVEAYYQLQPGYLPTVNYPSIRQSEQLIINGKKRYSCGVPNCKAKPFTRHYDLERHFNTMHKASNEQDGEKQDNKDQSDKVHFLCDHKKCTHTEPFRKDHCREHYREYHSEDLIKRGQPKHGKHKNSKKRPETVEEFLASRIKRLNFSWWRCIKCLQRVQVNPDGYTCSTCKLPCEPERVTFRENARKSMNDSRTADSISGFGAPPTSYVVTGCGQCENTWLPDENDDNLWVSCPRCQPGVKETMRS